MKRSLLTLALALLLCLGTLGLPPKAAPAAALRSPVTGEALPHPIQREDTPRWWLLLYPELCEGEEDGRCYSWLAQLFGHELTLEGGRWTWK